MPVLEAAAGAILPVGTAIIAPPDKGSPEAEKESGVPDAVTVTISHAAAAFIFIAPRAGGSALLPGVESEKVQGA